MSKSGPWKVTSNPIDGQTYYRVFRIRDTSAVDHSGNREYRGEYTLNRQEAADMAARLNEQEAGK